MGADLVEFALDLLGRHVGGGAQHRAALCDAGLLVLVGLAGEAEVHDDGFVLRVDHDVVGLEVAMHDLVGVGVFECECQLADEDCNLSFALQFLGTDVVREGAAVDVGHRDVVRALDFTDVVHRADVCVPEHGGGTGFTEEALDELLVVAIAELGNFQGDFAVEFGIVGEIDRTHGAFAKTLLDSVAAELVVQRPLLWPGELRLVDVDFPIARTECLGGGRLGGDLRVLSVGFVDQRANLLGLFGKAFQQRFKFDGPSASRAASCSARIRSGAACSRVPKSGSSSR